MNPRSRTRALEQIAHALGGRLGDTAPADALPSRIAALAGEPNHAVSYLVMAVLAATIPRPDAVKEFTRAWRLHGLEAMIAEAETVTERRRFRAVPVLPVRIVTDSVVADVTDTARSTFTTGIQRVAREMLSRWWGQHPIELVTWNGETSQFLTATAEEAQRVVLSPVSVGEREVIIPFRSALVLPEIAVENDRANRLRTIARFSGGRSVAIGFDAIPVTTAETAGPGMPGAFSKYLTTLARFDTVAAISSSAGQEYRGWRRMLAGAGLVGPEILDLGLPFNAAAASSGTEDETRAMLGLRDIPVVLAVGSREPRKNHLNLLHAAEISWRAGHEFALVLVGGNAWETKPFDDFLEDLRRKNRRIVILSGVEDAVVWDLYSLARFTVFCSLNEGFGLPVVESISHGTPVITSNFGSMRELGDGNGALLVDPRDPHAMADAMVTLLSDDGEVARLAAQTRTVETSTWDGYAAELWDVVVG